MKDCCEKCKNERFGLQVAMGVMTLPCVNERCSCHQEKYTGWEAEFDRQFKHVHHPLIQAENVIHDTRPIKDFIRSEKRKSREEVVDFLLEKLPEPTKIAPHIAPIRELIEKARNLEND